jgi:CHAT domain-containing protein
MWWCPSGLFTFLPIHAAASINLFIQSYTPTLDALIKARTPKATTSDSISLAAIGITDIPGKPHLTLPSVTKELNSIKNVIASANILSDANATVSSVLKTMRNHEWLHIACHGQQDASNPLNSCLQLYDGNLNLGQILAKDLPRAQFAFLSACQTAMGSSDLPNESLHLAGGFIEAGCQATIGTLWNMGDSDGPKVAELVYKHIINHRKALDVHATAEALYFAVQSLKDSGAPFERWIPFIHMGS